MTRDFPPEPQEAAASRVDEGVSATPEPQPPAHSPGEVFAGKYRLDRLLGQGGMGSVWRARSLVLEVDVAVKVVPHDVLGSGTSARLLREARAAASLSHASIVRTFDFGTTEQGEPFLVMELLEGGSLGRLLDERRRLPPATAVRIVLPVLSGLVAAHARGIVHRDLKPENIMLVPGEGDVLVPKLIDFGIVKLQEASTVATLTENGTLVGSPEYMSPEQARGLVDVDAKTDIWSVCVVLYEMITGVRPFTGPNHGAVLFAIFSRAPEPSVARSAGDTALWEILARGLEKAPADRWPDARALGCELAGWAEANGVTTDAAGMSIADQWLGRASLVGPAPVSRPGRSGRSSPESVTGVLTASVRAEPAEAHPLTDPPRGRRARGVALGAGVAAVIVAVAFSAARNPTPALPVGAGTEPRSDTQAPAGHLAAPPTLEPQIGPSLAPVAPVASASSAPPASAAPHEPPIKPPSPAHAEAPRPPTPGHPSPPPARSGKVAALPPPDF